MTNEEAIEWLDCLERTDKEQDVALRMAIKALEQESVLDKIRDEIEGWQVDIHDNEYDADKYDFVFERIFEILDKYKEGAEEKRFERILESASAQVPLRGKREENRPTWQQDREGGAE